MGGLLFGYDLGITGGVTSMEPLLIKFFPSVYKQMKDESNHESCLLLGFGVGYYNQSVPVYLSEMAPTTIRGALNIGFQMMITIGILIANLINYGTSKLEYGWRVSLGIGAVPVIMLCAGSLFLGDPPNSLLERGKEEEAKKMLQRIRGTENVEEEFQELIIATKAAKDVDHPWKNITQPKYRPQLTFCSLIPFFQQFTGINVIMFYAPVLFKTLGFGNDTSLMSSVITRGVNVVATFVSVRIAQRNVCENGQKQRGGELVS
ncbi:unnamed protein product [Sphenostylis stenocarpa]|uniref:Major facilitator superfamily (MFS) profile domain-containing protein n=1 Tax=Sphenostylis stenocarpa TaxID=92480 RepID=A0AA86SR49_9FABA|nr:unnamed protein product [Sphenostylis stenocarpa]